MEDYYNKEVLIKGKGNVFNGEIKGIVLKNTNPDLIVLKLDMGYNIALKKDNIESIKIIADVKLKPKENKISEIKMNKDKSVCLISLGGTIASKVDYEFGGVSSQFTSEDLLLAIPELKELANIDTITLSNKFSENIEYDDWVLLANKIKEVNKKYDAIIVAMGTDTLHYTSSAISFMIEKINIPIVFVGSQKSSDRPSTDAPYNLIGAISFALESKKAGVFVAMHYNYNDNIIAIHLGTKVRKMHSTRRDAFKSINVMPYAFVNLDLNSGQISKKEVIINQNLDILPNINDEDIIINTKLSDKVSILKYYPNINQDLVKYILEKNEIVIIEGVGLGHINTNLHNLLKKSNALLFMTSQTINGRVNLNVYATGREELNLGIIGLEDMLTETAYIKAKYLLANYPIKDIKSLMLKNLKGELSDRTEITDF